MEQKIDLRPQEGAPNGVKTMSLKIYLTGDFRSVLKYLGELEGLNYYFNINNIAVLGLYSKKNLAPGASSNTLPGFVNAEFDGKIYLRPNI